LGSFHNVAEWNIAGATCRAVSSYPLEIMVTSYKIGAVMLAALLSGAVSGAEDKGLWVTDWPNLSEIGHIVKSVKLEGAVESRKANLIP
jgi:hypothetical protein